MQYNFDVKDVFYALSDKDEVEKYVGKKVYLGDDLKEIQGCIDRGIVDTLERFVFDSDYGFKTKGSGFAYCLPADKVKVEAKEAAIKTLQNLADALGLDCVEDFVGLKVRATSISDEPTTAIITSICCTSNSLALMGGMYTLERFLGVFLAVYKNGEWVKFNGTIDDPF